MKAFVKVTSSNNEIIVNPTPSQKSQIQSPKENMKGTGTEAYFLSLNVFYQALVISKPKPELIFIEIEGLTLSTLSSALFVTFRQQKNANNSHPTTVDKFII